MLDARAARHPERRFALFEDGSTWTYARVPRRGARGRRGGLQRLGVRKGDRVLAWLPTGRPMVLTWFAANYLGAVFVPLNTAYRGDVLAHVVNSSGAARHGRAPPAHRRGSTGLQLAAPARRSSPSVAAAAAARSGARPCSTSPRCCGDAAELDDSVEIDHWDIQSIIYTSGTTGYSKGVLSPYLQLYCTAWSSTATCATASRSS